MQYSDKDGNLLAAPANIPATTSPDTAAALLVDAYPDLGLVTGLEDTLRLVRLYWRGCLVHYL